MSCFFQFDHESLPFTVVVEDDGKVAYAYLLHHEKIICHVWLYNCGPAPTEPEWRDRSKLPFTNPRAFVIESDMVPITDEEEVRVSWLDKGKDLDRAELFVKNKLHAVLAPGSRMGWCRNALKDGPLAKGLEQTKISERKKVGRKKTARKRN